MSSSPEEAPVSDTRTVAADRRKLIVEIVREAHDLSVEDLGKQVAATPSAIRRDLRVLEERGLVRRTYGRVMAVPGTLWELPIDERQLYRSETYSRIARRAAQELGDAQTIYVDEGNLPAMVVADLPLEHQLTIVTASLRTALSVSQNTVHEVVVVGGRIRKRTHASIGFWAQEMLGSLTLDLAIMGTNGVSASKGLTTPDERVAQVKRQAIQASKRTLVVTPHERFGAAFFTRFAALNEINLFVTDSGLPHHQRELLEQAGAQIVLAS